MSYRDTLIASGIITPAASVNFGAIFDRPVLRLDDRGRAQAERNIELGENGHRQMEMPLGLGLWHERALALRERRESQAKQRRA